MSGCPTKSESNDVLHSLLCAQITESETEIDLGGSSPNLNDLAMAWLDSLHYRRLLVVECKSLDRGIVHTYLLRTQYACILRRQAISPCLLVPMRLLCSVQCILHTVMYYYRVCMYVCSRYADTILFLATNHDHRCLGSRGSGSRLSPPTPMIS